MAKVGRAARVASRQRVETISADKTIASAETGELYLISAAATVTLPAVQDGAYFKFILVDAISAATDPCACVYKNTRSRAHSFR